MLSPAPGASTPSTLSPPHHDAAPFDLHRVTDEVQRQSEWVEQLFEEVGRVVVGQRYVVERLVIGLLAGGHVLLEGVPGLAKTLAVSALAGALQVPFQRIQFTPDLLPADLVGTLVYNPQQGTFVVRKGPVFTSLLLADEINRAPAKVQSALLEAMQERQVTIGDQTYRLQEPFLVLATQNPVEQEGTYPLPEAQVDRFMLKLRVGYPSREEELTILRRMATTTGTPAARPVVSPQQVLDARALLSGLYLDERVEGYIVDLVVASRQPQRYRVQGLQGLVAYGASPRATIALALAARAHAFLQRRAYVTPDDVRAVAHDILRHRLTLTFEAEAEGVSPDDLVQRLLDAVEVP